MSMACINLIPPSRLARVRLRRRVRVWAALCATYATLAGGACLTMASEHGRAQAPRAEFERVTRTLDARQDDLVSARAQGADLQRRLDAADLVTRHPDWSVLLRMLANLRGSDVTLSAIALEPVPEPAPEPGKPAGKAKGPSPREAYTLRLEGAARGQLGVADFAQALQDSGVFESVRLLDSKAEGEPGASVVRFRLACDLGDATALGGRKRP